MRGETDKAARAAIDNSASTLFGSTSGKTTSIGYLRWGKKTYANVRLCRYMKGFQSPLGHPEGIEEAIRRVYDKGKMLTPDQGGQGSTGFHPGGDGRSLTR